LAEASFIVVTSRLRTIFPRQLSDVVYNEWLLDMFWGFIGKRQQIWHRRFVEKIPPPWTNDPILARYRFTNVYREQDRGTEYVIKHILSGAPPRDVVFNVILYRLFNRPETHRALGFQTATGFDAKAATELLNARKAGQAIFSPAYTVVHQMPREFTPYGSNAENIIRNVLQGQVLTKYPTLLTDVLGAETYEAAWALLKQVQWISDFLANQIVLDLTYGLLPFTGDDFLVIGPGSEAGLKCLTSPTPEAVEYIKSHQVSGTLRTNNNFAICRDIIADLKARQQPVNFGRRKLTMNDIEHCLCEFWRYTRIGHTGSGTRRFRV